MQQDADKRRHERENIHFNVVIIGDTGIQRGCRVLNVSETGMMLMWSARKDDPKVKGGDLLYPIDSKVDLLFMVGRMEKKSFSLTGRVLWSEWNLLGVEFDRPNSALMKIISAHAARETAAESHPREAVPTPPLPAAPTAGNRSGTLLKLFSGVAVLALVALLAAWFLGAPKTPPGADPVAGGFGRGATNVIVPIPEAVRAKRESVEPVTVTIVEPGEGQRVSGRLEVNVVTRGDTPPERLELIAGGRLVASLAAEPWRFELDTRDHADGDLELRAVAYDGLGGRVIDTRHLAVENAPAEPAGAVEVAAEETAPEPVTPTTTEPAGEPTAEAAPAGEPAGDTPPKAPTAGDLTKTSADAAAEAAEAAETAEQVAETAGEEAAAAADPTPPAPAAVPETPRGGEWFVNLITLSNKESADRLTEQANAQGFPVVQERTLIRGQVLWRLRLYGFGTREEANDYGVRVQKALGLKEFLVRRRG